MTLVFCLAYIVEIKEFYDFWTSGYSFDIPIGPKYFLPSLLTWYLVLTTLGAIYLGANLRTEHIQNRINEVVESRPVSNLELASGRLFSFTVLMSIPVVFSLIFVSLHGYIDNLFGLGYGDSPEVWSALSFVVWDIVPNLAIWGAFAMFLTAILRSRLAGAMSTCLIYVGWCVLTFGLPLEVFEQPLRVPTLTLLMQAAPVLPLWLLESLQSFSAAAMFPSELAPTLMSGSLVVQRFAMLLIAVALVCGAAMFFPRSQESKKTGSIVGIACVLIATTLLGTMSYRAWHSTEQASRWAQTHIHLDASENLDLEHISGSVELRPGRFMSLELTLRLRTLDTLQTEEGVFAFNPDFRIKELWLNGTEIFDYDFQDGLLTVPWDSKATTVELRVLARGKPKESFAYMDASINVVHLNGKQLRRLRNLGTKSSIFHSDFVALLPGVHWYPTPGAATGRDDLDNTATDFFTFDLEVSTKRNWLVASTGQRQRLPDKAPSTYRIHSLVPVPSIAIVSSSFVRRSISVEGIEFELLFSHRHESKFEHLAGIEIDLQEWLTERLTHAESLGLEYPYKRFTVVVVPSTLRIFGGGWQMDSTLGPPGMFLVRESGILSVRYEREEYRRWVEREQRHRYVLSPLLNKLRLDLVSENPYTAFSKNFLTNQTKPTEAGAVALQFVLDRMISKLVMENEMYFSIHDLLTSDLAEVRRDLWWGKEFAEKYFDEPTVWFSAETNTLSDLKRLSDHELSRKVLWHKGYAIIRTLLDSYESEALSTIFREILAQNRGGNFSFENLATVTAKQHRSMDSVIGDLLMTTKVPGYIASQPLVSVIETLDNTDEYLTSFVLYNDEESPGFIRVFDGASPQYDLKDSGVLTHPIWFEGNQAKKISVRSKQPFQSLRVHPHVSFNRAFLAVYPELPNEYTQTLAESDVPPLIEPIDWRPTVNQQTVVVVDDTDPGFSIVIGSSRERVQPRLPVIKQPNYQNLAANSQYHLPEHPDDFNAHEWHRVAAPVGFGKYRATFVRIKNGRGSTSARFEAELPNAGLWQLECHVFKFDLPERYVRGWYDITIITEREYPAGDLAITVKNGINQTTTEFGFTDADSGWQLVGEYEIVEDAVAVLISDAAIENTGTTVYADAIRWTYLGEEDIEESVQK
ncbi:MAG: hypothetical protein F4219_01880 [Gammaproteobacteria bacterium]|nr:hypothetical protein [Gammaproteobacteria bacterium]